jgi:hypothetical protein
LHLNEQWPEMHAGVPFATTDGHMTPQVPQLLGSVCLLVQVPLQRSGVVPVQLAVQLLETQTGVPPLHCVLQPPQWFLSVVSSTHVPLQLL